MQNAKQETRFLNYEEAARYLGVTPKWMRTSVSERRVPFHKFGKLVRFDVTDLDRFASETRIDRRPS